MNQFIKYVGLDTHKDTIAVAMADIVGGKPRYYGEIANTPTALSTLMKDVRRYGCFWCMGKNREGGVSC